MTLAMNPIAFSLGGLEVHWYGIILACGALVGLLLAVNEGKRFGISPDFFMDLLLVGVPSAIVCARIYYVAFEWEDYRHNFWDVFAIWHGGIAIYGALIGAVIGAVFYARAKGYSFLRIADICAPSLLAGQLIGRWGNFVNQEAHGGPVEESFLRHTLHLPGFIVDQMNIQGVYYHPTFLYESLWNVVGIVLLLWLRRRPFLRAGELFMGYFIWYSFGRFFVEGLRTDSLAFTGPNWLASLLDALWSPMSLLFGDAGSMASGNIRTSQLLALLLIIAMIAIIVYRRKAGYAQERYSDPIVSSKAAAPAEAEAQADSDAAELSAPGETASEPK